MTTGKQKTDAAQVARPEQRASKRLAADLLRFEKAFERLERSQMAPVAYEDDDERPGDPPPIDARDMNAYVKCLDEAIKQLAAEFADDEAIVNLVKQREASRGASADASSMASPSAPRPPHRNVFEAQRSESTAMPHVVSQVDTSTD